MTDSNAVWPTQEHGIILRTEGPEETHRLGQSLASELRPGDTVLLTGQLGAGKSELARAIIRAIARDPFAEVASPSYTLVNVYRYGGTEIWHADLYRIDEVEELEEIGLSGAVDTAVLLVEWAGKWPDPPARRLEINIEPRSADARDFRIAPIGPDWQRVVGGLSDWA